MELAGDIDLDQVLLAFSRAEEPFLAVTLVKALVWFWLIDETLSANLVYQDVYEIGSTTPSDEAMTKIMTMVIAW